MATKCPLEGCQTYGKTLDVEPKIMDHLMEDHGVATIQLKLKKTMLGLKYDGDIRGKGKSFVKVPFIIEFTGVHFLFVIARHNARHYFWLYLVEDGILSGGRQFHAQLDLLPNNKMIPKRGSDPMNIIYPVSTPVDEILKNTLSLLYFVSDKGLKKNYLKGDTYQLCFSLKELERKVIEIPQPQAQEESSLFSDELNANQLEGNMHRVDLIPTEEIQPLEIEMMQIETVQNEQPEKVEEKDNVDVRLEKLSNSAENSSSGSLHFQGPNIIITCPKCNTVVYKMTGSGNVTIATDLMKDNSAQTEPIISEKAKETTVDKKQNSGQVTEEVKRAGNESPEMTEYELLQRRMWKQIHHY